MATFVLEIGSEELPARFLPGEEAELADRMGAALDKAALAHGPLRVLSTPRRAVVVIEDLAPVQSEREEVVVGPPARIAYGPDGAPTKALESFARANGVGIAEVYRTGTEKGEYVAVRKRTGGASAEELLAEICPEVIQTLPFAKRMRWGAHSLAYARPLRWILALLDDAVVPFSVGHLRSGRETWGHRVHGAGPHSVPRASEYFSVVETAGGIVADPARRRKIIIEGGNAQAAAVGGTVVWKESLLDEVQGLVEHPVPLLADFDPAYLEVPAEVLLTSMESHQKSFGIKGPDGRLLPHFLTVLNLTPRDMATVKRGWERVLRARLEDARFFWRADSRENFDTWLEKLDHVIFIGPLGSMGDKTRRLEALCRWLAELVPGADPSLAARAGRLSKADLVSGMVGEFDTLQGIMGGIYAANKGEAPEVAAALREQYLPAGPDSPTPQSLTGALLSLADKADTLAGCFGLNKVPTGAADPNGLRRCALGIIRILLAFDLRLDVRRLFARARELYGEKRWKLAPDAALEKLMEFFRGRLRQYFLSQGQDTVLVDAALGAGVDDVPACAARLAALAAFVREEANQGALLAFKRVDNIIRKQAGKENVSAQWDEALLCEPAEQALATALARTLPEVDALLDAGDMAGALRRLAEMRPGVDAFFDGVMVMCDDAALRRNRLALLQALGARVARVADIAALQI
ncbi:glycine--tRNA ligase subunit beta [uncultured Desulfovibrio sp.]|uniref:glycine--tRNA ligase subunit beta n=1 Tax=uncultured Desulfovibrio sp. TaxID=167968 RepID=UPI002804B217|nr:glycine--tRNA ligase subunit beta [uncultured Desulfovibrio sp.]